MRSVVRVVGGLLALLVVVSGALLVGARFADGPIAIIPGGPFTSGELVSSPEPDWSFVRDVREVEFQLLEPARSRTTWILYHDGKAYIPCGYMTTWWGKIWKQWPLEAEKDPRILLRIGDALYERQLVRVQEGPIVAPLLAELSRKYGGGREIPLEAVTSGYLWLYELAPRGRAPAAEVRRPRATTKRLGRNGVGDGDELPGWARGERRGVPEYLLSPPEVMAEVQRALDAGRPARDFRERLMMLQLAGQATP